MKILIFFVSVWAVSFSKPIFWSYADSTSYGPGYGGSPVLVDTSSHMMPIHHGPIFDGRLTEPDLEITIGSAHHIPTVAVPSPTVIRPATNVPSWPQLPIIRPATNTFRRKNFKDVEKTEVKITIDDKTGKDLDHVPVIRPATNVPVKAEALPVNHEPRVKVSLGEETGLPVIRPPTNVPRTDAGQNTLTDIFMKKLRFLFGDSFQPEIRSQLSATSSNIQVEIANDSPVPPAGLQNTQQMSLNSPSEKSSVSPAILRWAISTGMVTSGDNSDLPVIRPPTNVPNLD